MRPASIFLIIQLSNSRIIVGGLLKVGFHKKTAEDIRKSLEIKERYVVGPTVPPQGLTLVNIEYLE